MKYFIPQYHHWYMYMVHYPSRYRYCLTLLVLFAVCSIWYGLLYRPLKHSINYYVQTNKILGNQIQEQIKAQELCASMAKSIKGFEHDLQAYQVTPFGANELITFIAQEAMSANLSFLNCAAEPAVDYGWYQVQPIIIDLQGPFSAIVQWLKTVSAKTKLVSISSISINSVDKTTVKCSALITGMCIRSIT